MIVGLIKHCPNCDKDSYIKAGVTECPKCGISFNEYPVNKAPAGWLKMEDYEISRRSVETMVRNGDLTMDDIRNSR